jgi:hypothetical protein
MARTRPHTIILTELVQRSKGTAEVEIAVPVASIRKLATERVTLWDRTPEGAEHPHEESVTRIERNKDREVFMVKESVRQITNLLNGVDVNI